MLTNMLGPKPDTKSPIYGVLFDFDGTLTRQGAFDFDEIKREIGCPPGTSTLVYIDSLTDPEAKSRADSILEKHEERAAKAAQLATGARELITSIKTDGVPMGIITRNSWKALQSSFTRFNNIDMEEFDIIITRDSPFQLKPHPEGILHACGHFSIDPSTMLVVGDYVDDITAGNTAGAMTVFVDNRDDRSFDMPESTWIIRSLEELGVLFGDPAGAGGI